MSEPSAAPEWRQPGGLATLFFVELWERFAYYGMRALAVFYMIRSALAMGDSEAYAIYGTFSLLAYVSPAIGAALLTTLLDHRRGVILGSLFMLVGLQFFAIQEKWALYTALALMAVGSGLLKPAISARVGDLYSRFDRRRGPGFVLFYIGINIGAMLAPFVCGYVGETQGWGRGFGVATFGMIIGLLIYVGTPSIRGTMAALGVLAALYFMSPTLDSDSDESSVRGMLRLASGFLPQVALLFAWRGLLTDKNDRLSEVDGESLAVRAADWRTAVVAVGGLMMAAFFALTISGFSAFTESGERLSLVGSKRIEKLQATEGLAATLELQFFKMAATIEGSLFLAVGFLLLLYMALLAWRNGRQARRGIAVILILCLFSTLYWTGYEVGGSAIYTITSYNVDRVHEERSVTADEIGKTIRLHPTQEQLGYDFAGSPFDVGAYESLGQARSDMEIGWPVTAEHVGMGIAKAEDEVPASVFQSVNPIAICLLGVLVVVLGTFCLRRGLGFGVFLSVALGFLLLALGWAMLWIGLETSSDRAVMSASWMIFALLFHAASELFIAPFVLAAITRLAPRGQAMLLLSFLFLTSVLANPLSRVLEATVFHDQPFASSGSIVPADNLEAFNLRLSFLTYASIALAVCSLVLAFPLRRWADPRPSDDELAGTSSIDAQTPVTPIDS